MNKGKRKGRAPKEPDPRLTSHYLRTVRRTDVMRLLVPSALRTSSVCVLNSVPMYFMGFRTVLTSATGAVSFGTAASWLIASSFLSVWWQGESVFRVAGPSLEGGQVAVLRLHAASTGHVTAAAYSCERGERITQLQYFLQLFANFGELRHYEVRRIPLPRTPVNIEVVRDF